MFERFTREAKDVVKRSFEEAAALGAPAIEAEHLLIALAEPASGPVAAGVLSGAGLDRARLVAALDGEIERSLDAIGLDAGPLLAEAPRAAWRRPRWGQSATLALKRSVRVAEERKERRLLAGHILLGVLRAEAGTVPRALRVAGVEPAELAARTAAAMD